jgi:hypothetical protein
MELGILPDDRTYGSNEEYPLELTPIGKELYKALKPILDALDLSFPVGEDGLPSTRMAGDEESYNRAIRNFIADKAPIKDLTLSVFLNMSAVQQMLAFLYHICRNSPIPRQQIYEQFFQAPFVRQFCDQEGIDEATEEAARHRLPFLLNVLDACGIITTSRNEIHLLILALSPYLARSHHKEAIEISAARLNAVAYAWPDDLTKIEEVDLSIVRELFGLTFLTKQYFLKELILVKE